jgi:hypothetical protein
MKNSLISSALLTAALVTVRPVQAGMGQNNIGPSVILGSGQTSFGVDARFGLSDNFSLRPNIYFPDNTTTFGAAVTYDFQAPDADRKLTPYLGLGIRFNSGTDSNTTAGYVTAGADYNLDNSIVLKGNLSVPFSSNNATTTVGLGAGLRF